MSPWIVDLPDKRIWLRVADASWSDPLSPQFSRESGGRWNPPGSHATLYLNGDIFTAKLQIDRMLAGFPVDADDLDASAYVLVAATLPRSQQCADAVTPGGLLALRLPDTYPSDSHGRQLGHATCQPIGAQIRQQRLRGVWCRSAATASGKGRELAWFPATRRSTAVPRWTEPLPLAKWRHAIGWEDLGLEGQPDP